MSGSVVVAGSIAQRPGYGGHAWALLQWVLGFRALGWDVLLLDRLDEAMCGPARGIDAVLGSPHVACFRDIVRRFDLAADASLTVRAQGAASRTVGLSRSRVIERVAGADFVLDIMGFLDDAELLGRARRRVFLDIDPGFPQMWNALGLSQPFERHDDHVSIGLNIGRPQCRIPTCGIGWITTVPPVALDYWTPTAVPRNAVFTSIGSWRGPYAPVEYAGDTFGLRVHEFRRFIDLPARTGLPFDAALDIDRADRSDIERLENGGWHLIEPGTVAVDTDAYAGFLRASLAEFMVAKNMYVRSRSGWFSDRSIAYLASGRPVLAQDTGLRDHLPAGHGLFLFEDLAEAAAGAATIAADPRRHGRAARELAEVFDARLVLRALTDRLSARAAPREAPACA